MINPTSFQCNNGTVTDAAVPEQAVISMVLVPTSMTVKHIVGGLVSVIRSDDEKVTSNARRLPQCAGVYPH